MKKKINLILNILIIIFGIIGTYMMLTFKGDGSGLTASGVQNLKFFTVLSNELCAIISVAYIICCLMKKRFPVVLKLMAAAAVGLTFVVIAAFLAPMYPDLNLYEGGNLWFHLILPVTAMVEFILFEVPEGPEGEDKKARGKRIPIRYTFYAALFALVYGLVYLINILINGIGVWPDTNDWYGFLNWGYPIGFCIFGFIVFMNWLIAVILRVGNLLINRKTTNK